MLNLDQWQLLVEGAWVTVQVTFWSALVGTVLALVGGILSLSPFALFRWISRVYVEIFRGVSAIILLFWAFFALPQLLGIFMTPLQAGILAFGTNMGAYGTELVRGAINAVERGQTEASVALSLTSGQRMRHVILPQAVVTMLPPYGNLLIEVMKATALVSLITLRDLTFEAQNLRVNRAAESVDIFVPVLLLYFVIAYGITLLVRGAEVWFSRGLTTGRRAGRVQQ